MCVRRRSKENPVRRHLTSVAVVVAATLVLSACSGGGSAQSSADSGELTPVTVGVIPIVDVAPIYLGVKEGFFEEEGLDVTLELAQGGAAIVPAVVSGDYQFGFSNVTSLVLATDQGVPLKAVAAGNFTTGEAGADFSAVVVPEGSEIASAKDLEGKTVAVNTLNNIGDSTVRAAVEANGGDPAAVEFVELGFPDMPAALAERQVDAAWVVEPFTTTAVQQGGTAVVSNFAETDPELMVAAYFTSQSFAAESPETVEAFTAAMNRSLDHAAENPEAAAVLDDYTEIAPEVKEAMVMPRFSSEFSEDSVNLLNDLAAKYGLVEEPVDVSALLP
ncbi:ABC transporter substrate-binding protein [Myceligenerans sp. TRM 65318]|uniref:ABC transporter substrate-binding protein n=1 Tax=Myceligenerans pegani TaxID=2776917 RepID=A0ABR9N5Q9_9MICO|nr:ABC transporter substrate-binding protein [Myceligenerans sp. TRM 65318]MBE3021273.1 ABC transporter substrate-binding protein [Myceligenerans sp. TRM 65318]